MFIRFNSVTEVASFLYIMAVDTVGLLLVLVLYILILAMGIIFYYKFKHKHNGDIIDSSMVAGRDIGLVVGILSMSGTVDHDSNLVF